MQTYLERLNKVITYIEINLDKKLDLESLADIACMSKYHFHRIIKSYMGESLGMHINRLRNEKGARLLKYSCDSISEIAYKTGYETPTSFTKSFKKQFLISPSLYRKNPNHSFESVKKLKDKTNFELQVNKKRIPSFQVIHRRYKGKITEKKIFAFWEEFIEYANNNLISFNTKNLLGMPIDDPAITHEEQRRFDLCIRIENQPLNKNILLKTIAGGNYLCFAYTGDFKFMGDVYDQIFRDYIIKDNIILRDEPVFEQYLSDVKNTPRKKHVANIFIPII